MIVRLYRAVTDPDVRGARRDSEFEHWRAALPEDWARISTALDEARSEPSFSRFNDVAYWAFLEEHSHLNQRLMAMRQDSNLFSHAGVVVTLVPELKPLTEKTAEAFAHLAQALRTQSTAVDMGALDEAERDLDQRLQTLRDARVTSPFTLDRMLPFWSFPFNLKEIVAICAH